MHSTYHPPPASSRKSSRDQSFAPDAGLPPFFFDFDFGRASAGGDSADDGAWCFWIALKSATTARVATLRRAFSRTTSSPPAGAAGAGASSARRFRRSRFVSRASSSSRMSGVRRFARTGSRPARSRARIFEICAPMPPPATSEPVTDTSSRCAPGASPPRARASAPCRASAIRGRERGRGRGRWRAGGARRSSPALLRARLACSLSPAARWGAAVGDRAGASASGRCASTVLRRRERFRARRALWRCGEGGGARERLAGRSP
mmetsp:Transcript_36555/g.113083  ORF Transcript_36555/g.113083 Transcript_36555/m.113083 type:complete len:263 (+) Transcript_36555:1-789(+)